jgi:hypothetical protein
VNPLFLAVCGALIVGLVAGLLAGDEHELVYSNLVYRLAIGGIVAALLYGVVVVVWLAWHRRALKRLNLGPAGAETPDQSTEAEVSARDEEVTEFMNWATTAIDDLDKRLRDLEP